jgi:hypothetical protein
MNYLNFNHCADQVNKYTEKIIPKISSVPVQKYYWEDRQCLDDWIRQVLESKGDEIEVMFQQMKSRISFGPVEEYQYVETLRVVFNPLYVIFQMMYLFEGYKPIHHNHGDTKNEECEQSCSKRRCIRLPDKEMSLVDKCQIYWLFGRYYSSFKDLLDLFKGVDIDIRNLEIDFFQTLINTMLKNGCEVKGVELPHAE